MPSDAGRNPFIFQHAFARQQRGSRNAKDQLSFPQITGSGQTPPEEESNKEAILKGKRRREEEKKKERRIGTECLPAGVREVGDEEGTAQTRGGGCSRSRGNGGVRDAHLRRPS